jgi:hypothetical protein
LSKKISFIPFSVDYNENIHKVSPASKTIPEWFRKTKNQVNDEKNYGLSTEKPSNTNQTIKSCIPFLDAMMTGYTYTLPIDVEVKFIDGNYECRWRLELDLIGIHNPKTYELMPFSSESSKTNNPYEQIFRWHNPFGIITPPGYSVFFTHPINRFELPFRTFTGVVDTDSYNASVQFPFTFTKEIQKDKPLIIEKGTPVAQFFPFKRENWVSEHLEYDLEYHNEFQDNFFSKIYKSYKTQYWAKKKYQ